MEEDPELEALRQRRAAELRQQGGAPEETQAQQQAAEQQAMAQIDSGMKRVCTPEAFEQWSTAKVGNRNNAYLAAMEILKAANMGRAQGKIDLPTLKKYLSAIHQATTKEWNIRRG